jgi:hypothetical protein
MIRRSDDYIEYCRDIAKRARDPHDLALRGKDKHETTKIIHQQIADAVGLHSEDALVDIGCGDGSMLRLASQAGVRSAIGLLATNEEVEIVRKLAFDVRQALSDRLPLPNFVSETSGRVHSDGRSRRSPACTVLAAPQSRHSK